MIRALPLIGPVASEFTRRLKTGKFQGSAEYWERRYRSGRNSGAGSYNRLAEFKAKFLNGFVSEKQIRSVVEFGSGDGAQLALSNYPSYAGIDVSHTVLRLARERFSADPTKKFHHSSEVPDDCRAELALSLDVIYHLVEDEVYERYMRDLFDAAGRYVIIYASNVDQQTPEPHVRHRHFTAWVTANRPDFSLLQHVANEFPLDSREPDDTSFADFYVFERS
jgi:predicted O-methyltransferase YrrM